MATRLPQPPPPPVPSAALRWRRVFRGERRQVAVMRRWLEELLPACEDRDNVIMVAGELGANAVMHTRSGQGGWFAVEITCHPRTVRVGVADCGGTSCPHLVDDPAADHGRGLLIVQGLALRTGVSGDWRGRLVWADIPWDGGDLLPPVPARGGHEAAIRDDLAELASRFKGVPAWFGRATLQWWALPNGGALVTAPTAPGLAALLTRSSARPAAQGPRHTEHRTTTGSATLLLARGGTL